jgi:tRNA (guanine-N7-)-methyltransferase
MAALRAELAELFCERERGRGLEHEHIVLEIGCGHGHFLTAYAAAHPEKFCVGFDIELNRIERAGRKRARAELENNLNNLVFVRAEATEFFTALPEHVRFTDVFILFPDPWPKRRHHKNRMIRPEILSALAARAVGATEEGQGTRLYFRTDYAPYFADARQTIAEHGAWIIAPAGTPWLFEYQTVFQGRAERSQGFQSLIAFSSVRKK